MNSLPLLDDLRLFCTVARKRSFVGTAAELGASPAYVSKRIGLLERTLNVTLLHRTTRRVSVTEDGETVCQWAQRILEDVGQMADAISERKTSLSGFLRVCTSTGFGRNRVAPAISRLALLHPPLEIQLELLDRPVDLVREGFDLDIRLGGLREPHLVAQRIAANQRVLCAAPSYLARHKAPEKLADLARHQCISIRERDQAFSVWKLQGPQGVQAVKVTGTLSANNGEIAHRWALDGHGIILRSLWDVGPSIRAGRLVRLLPEYAQEADVWAVSASRPSSSAKVRVFVRFLEQWLREQAEPEDAGLGA